MNFYFLFIFLFLLIFYFLLIFFFNFPKKFLPPQCPTNYSACKFCSKINCKMHHQYMKQKLNLKSMLAGWLTGSVFQSLCCISSFCFFFTLPNTSKPCPLLYRPHHRTNEAVRNAFQQQEQHLHLAMQLHAGWLPSYTAPQHTGKSYFDSKPPLSLPLSALRFRLN